MTSNCVGTVAPSVGEVTCTGERAESALVGGTGDETSVASRVSLGFPSTRNCTGRVLFVAASAVHTSAWSAILASASSSSPVGPERPLRSIVMTPSAVVAFAVTPDTGHGS